MGLFDTTKCPICNTRYNPNDFPVCPLCGGKGRGHSGTGACGVVVGGIIVVSLWILIVYLLVTGQITIW